MSWQLFLHSTWEVHNPPVPSGCQWVRWARSSAAPWTGLAGCTGRIWHQTSRAHPDTHACTCFRGEIWNFKMIFQQSFWENLLSQLLVDFVCLIHRIYHHFCSKFVCLCWGMSCTWNLMTLSLNSCQVVTSLYLAIWFGLGLSGEMYFCPPGTHYIRGNKV